MLNTLFTVLPFSIIVPYYLLVTFEYYQIEHSLYIQREKEISDPQAEIFHLILNVFSFVGLLTVITFLVMYGFKVAWWAPLVLLAITPVFISSNYLLERLIGALVMSLIGFLGIPISIFFLFSNMLALSKVVNP